MTFSGATPVTNLNQPVMSVDMSKMGLLQEHTVGDGLERERIYTKTPLWAVALKLETDRHLPELVVN